jgi:disulfide bond formation protein DsbB
MWRSSTHTACLAAVLAAAAALGVALASERWGGLVPCALCLVQRWPYRLAIALGLVALVLPNRAARVLLGLIVLVVLAGAALAAVHVGVEQHAWPSPLPECAAPHLSGQTVAARLAELPERPGKLCDAPTYLIPELPISMATMNLIYALVLSGSLGVFLWRSRGRRR